MIHVLFYLGMFHIYWFYPRSGCRYSNYFFKRSGKFNWKLIQQYKKYRTKHSPAHNKVSHHDWWFPFAASTPV